MNENEQRERMRGIDVSCLPTRDVTFAHAQITGWQNACNNAVVLVREFFKSQREGLVRKKVRVWWSFQIRTLCNTSSKKTPVGGRI